MYIMTKDSDVFLIFWGCVYLRLIRALFLAFGFRFWLLLVPVCSRNAFFLLLKKLFRYQLHSSIDSIHLFPSCLACLACRPVTLVDAVVRRRHQPMHRTIPVFFARVHCRDALCGAAVCAAVCAVSWQPGRPKTRRRADLPFRCSTPLPQTQTPHASGLTPYAVGACTCSDTPFLIGPFE